MPFNYPFQKVLQHNGLKSLVLEALSTQKNIKQIKENIVNLILKQEKMEYYINIDWKMVALRN